MAGLLCYLVVKDQLWETTALPDLSATPSTLTVYCAPLLRDDDGVSVAFRAVEAPRQEVVRSNPHTQISFSSILRSLVLL